MVFVYTKEEKPKKVFDINLTDKEIQNYMGGNIFMDYPNLNPNDYVVYRGEKELDYPYYDKESNTIKEDKLHSILLYGKKELLNDGEFIKDNKIVVAEIPKNLIKPSWDKDKLIYIESYTKDEMFSNIDSLKSEILANGYEWRGHRQKAREKDIALMGNTIPALNDLKRLGKPCTITWYFEENDGVSVGVDDLTDLRITGLIFIQSVYDIENKFKLGKLKQYTKEEYAKEVLNRQNEMKESYKPTTMSVNTQIHDWTTPNLDL